MGGVKKLEITPKENINHRVEVRALEKDSCSPIVHEQPEKTRFYTAPKRRKGYGGSFLTRQISEVKSCLLTFTSRFFKTEEKPHWQKNQVISSLVPKLANTPNLNLVGDSSAAPKLQELSRRSPVGGTRGPGAFSALGRLHCARPPPHALLPGLLRSRRRTTTPHVSPCLESKIGSYQKVCKKMQGLFHVRFSCLELIFHNLLNLGSICIVLLWT